ncbi:MAG: hypothetical protein Q3960_01665 [Lactobacillus sp.]|nr:hypothetical protein [Lactobacillus sp.]
MKKQYGFYLGNTGWIAILGMLICLLISLILFYESKTSFDPWAITFLVIFIMWLGHAVGATNATDKDVHLPYSHGRFSYSEKKVLKSGKKWELCQFTLEKRQVKLFLFK